MNDTTIFIVRHHGNKRNSWSVNDTIEQARASRDEALTKWPQYRLEIVKREVVETIVDAA